MGVTGSFVAVARQRAPTPKTQKPQSVRNMDANTYLNVTTALSIPRTELQYKATRAGGPGGQHVNTSSTQDRAPLGFARFTSGH